MKLVDFEVTSFNGRADVCELHSEKGCGAEHDYDHPCKQEFQAVLLPDYGTCYIDATIKVRGCVRLADVMCEISCCDVV